MSDVIWAINGTTFEAAGIEGASVVFRSGATSEMRLQLGRDFDAAPLLAFGTAVTITRSGTPFFKGIAKLSPASANDQSESQSLEIADVWQQLEDTIYQESWALGAGSVMLPVAVLGVSGATGARIDTAQQIQEAVAYAASVGVGIQMGSIPTGLPLWPSEVRNISVAEVIRLSTRYHPDWSIWIDHSTSPHPTLNIGARATLAATSLAATDLDDAQIVQRNDQVPAAVRIVYLTANIIDGVTYRDVVVDKFPAGGPNSGPRVLSSVVELAGGQMQFQKSRIQTRPLPTDQASAKTWLIRKFPHLANVNPAHFNVTAWDRELIPDADPHPDPINPRAARLAVTDVDDLPRELVRGQIEDWMRRKVGRVRISASIQPAAGATAAERAAIAKAIPAVTVTATNAVTKTYKGVTQWSAPESAPAGIAQRIYEGLATPQYEGRCTFVAEEVGAARYHGTRLNISGGGPGWGSMNAVVNQVSQDINTGSTTLAIGPAPYLSADDFLELQRLFRARPVTWMSQAERTSNELGAESEPGSKGDTVGGYDGPTSQPDPPDLLAPALPLESYIVDGKVGVRPGFVGNVMPTIGGVALNAATPPTLTPAAGDNWLHLRGTYEPSVFTLAAGFAAVGSSGLVSNVSFVLTSSQAASPPEDYPRISGGSANDGHFDILWGKIVKDGDQVTIEVPSGGGDAQIVFMPPDRYIAFRNANTSAP